MNFLHLELRRGQSWAYGWAIGRAPRSNLGEGGSAGRVYKAIANVVVPVFLASSHPHNDFSIKGLGPRIAVWPMDLASHLCVRLDTTVDGRVAVRRGRVVRVVGDIGCRLALAGQSPSHERVALLAFM